VLEAPEDPQPQSSASAPHAIGRARSRDGGGFI
jgi:hypothetical protein